jgi:hypothetical protein
VPVFEAAQSVGRERRVDPLLIIAIIGIESRFNPFAESRWGAKGLMQVIPGYHLDKVPQGAGEQPLLDPVTNIQVGVHVLEEAIRWRGSLTAGLQHYGGAPDDPDRCLREQGPGREAALEQAARRGRRARLSGPRSPLLRVEIGLGDQSGAGHAPDGLARLDREHEFGLRERHSDSLVEVQEAGFVLVQDLLRSDSRSAPRRSPFPVLRRVEVVKQREAAGEQMAIVFQVARMRGPFRSAEATIASGSGVPASAAAFRPADAVRRTPG